MSEKELAALVVRLQSLLVEVRPREPAGAFEWKHIPGVDETPAIGFAYVRRRKSADSNRWLMPDRGAVEGWVELAEHTPALLGLNSGPEVIVVPTLGRVGNLPLDINGLYLSVVRRWIDWAEAADPQGARTQIHREPFGLRNRPSGDGTLPGPLVGDD